MRSVSGIVASTTRRTAKPKRAALQLLLDRDEQVLGLDLADFDVRVARHMERVRRDDLLAGEEGRQIGDHHLLQPGGGARTVDARGIPHRRGRRHRHEAGERLRDFDARDVLARLVPHDDEQIQAPVRDMREGMARIDRQRCEDGEDLVHEVVGRRVPLILIEFVVRQEVNIVLRQRGEDDIIQVAALRLH